MVNWDQWASSAETPAEISDNPATSPGLVDPDSFDTVIDRTIDEIGIEDVDDLELPEKIPETRDLLKTLQEVEQEEEAIQSAKPKSSDGDLPDLPDETLSVVAEVHRTRLDVDTISSRLESIETALGKLTPLLSLVVDLDKRMQSMTNVVEDTASSNGKIKRELSTLTNSLTSMVSASERKMMNTLQQHRPATGSITVAADPPPLSVITPGAAQSQSSAAQAPTSVAPAKPRKAVIPDW